MLRVLHLSDLHFHVAGDGEELHHAYRHTREVPFPTATRPFGRRRMVEEIVRALEGTSIDGVIVTGDVTYRARAAEFELFVDQTRELLRSLKLSPDKLLLVPGNHDADWSKNGPERFDAYRQAYRDLRGKDAADLCQDEITLVGTRDEHVRFLGVNSCLIESEEHAGMGAVGEELLADLLRPNEPVTTTALCLHHHLLPVSYEEPEYEQRKRSSVTLDAKAVLDIAQRRGVDIILHGHQHQPNLAAYGAVNPLHVNDEPPSLVWLAGAGSAGAVEHDLGQANQRHFQVLSFETVESDVHCTLQAYTSHPTNNQEFAAFAEPLLIHLGVGLPTGTAPHLRIERAVLQEIRGATRHANSKTAVDKSDLFIVLLKTKFCQQVNMWLRNLRNDDLRVEGVYDLYGDFDLLVKVRASNGSLIRTTIVDPLREAPLKYVTEQWGRVIDVRRERYTGSPSFMPVNEASHSIKAFIYFTFVKDGDPIAEMCSDIAARFGTRTVVSGAYIGDGATELMVEYLVACGAYYELSEIVTAIEGRIESMVGEKVTLLAQRAWETPLLAREKTKQVDL
jgi:3',5'-cyclic AMP phosphodiesterase CpdA